MLDFLKKLLRFFEDCKIPYMLSGSVAMSVYTLPRSTRDFDFVVHLTEENIADLVTQFKIGYYFDEDAVREAVLHKRMFNIIDHNSNYKADFVILKDEIYRQTEFARRRRIHFIEMPLFIVSPEDLILSKLIWVQDIQSSIQFEDIRLLSAVPEIDWSYIWHWVDTLNLNTFDLIKQ